jgi:hypothetical protein
MDTHTPNALWNAYISMMHRRNDTHDALDGANAVIMHTQLYKNELHEIRRRLIARRRYQTLALTRLLEAYTNAMMAIANSIRN